MAYKLGDLPLLLRIVQNILQGSVMTLLRYYGMILLLNLNVNKFCKLVTW